mgnify:CR=1 FL=1
MFARSVRTLQNRAFPALLRIQHPVVASRTLSATTVRKNASKFAASIEEAFRANPNIAEKAIELQKTFEEMGVKPGQPPSLVTLAKVLGNKETRAKINELKEELERSGVAFSGADAQALMKMWGLEK